MSVNKDQLQVRTQDQLLEDFNGAGEGAIKQKNFVYSVYDAIAAGSGPVNPADLVLPKNHLFVGGDDGRAQMVQGLDPAAWMGAPETRTIPRAAGDYYVPLYESNADPAHPNNILVDVRSQAEPLTIAGRDASGRFKSVDPVDPADVATKAYVDANAGGGSGPTLAAYQTLVGAANGSGAVAASRIDASAWAGSAVSPLPNGARSVAAWRGEAAGVNVSYAFPMDQAGTEPVANYIVVRETGGHIQVPGNPIAPTQAASKAYVDSLRGLKIFHLLGSSYDVTGADANHLYVLERVAGSTLNFTSTTPLTVPFTVSGHPTGGSHTVTLQGGTINGNPTLLIGPGESKTLVRSAPTEMLVIGDGG